MFAFKYMPLFDNSRTDSKKKGKTPKMKMLKNCWQSAWEPIKIVCCVCVWCFFLLVIGFSIWFHCCYIDCCRFFSHVQKKPWLTDRQTYIWLHVAGEFEILYLKKIDSRLKLKRNWLIWNAPNMNEVDRIRLCCQFCAAKLSVGSAQSRNCHRGLLPLPFEGMSQACECFSFFT